VKASNREDRWLWSEIFALVSCKKLVINKTFKKKGNVQALVDLGSIYISTSHVVTCVRTPLLTFGVALITVRVLRQKAATA
jgi:hypothetical protein